MAADGEAAPAAPEAVDSPLDCVAVTVLSIKNLRHMLFVLVKATVADVLRQVTDKEKEGAQYSKLLWKGRLLSPDAPLFSHGITASCILHAASDEACGRLRLRMASRRPPWHELKT